MKRINLNLKNFIAILFFALAGFSQNGFSQIIDDPINMIAYRGNNNANYQIRIDLICEPEGTVNGGCRTSLGIYTDNSRLTKAAKHHFGLTLGHIYVITVQIRPGQEDYDGCEQNGVISNDYGSFDGSYYMASYYIESDGPPVAVPNTPTSNSPQCESVTITRNGNPPAGETWYWQTSENGTSIANSNETYTATSSGTYYIRSRKTCNGLWSLPDSVSVIISAAPGDISFRGGGMFCTYTIVDAQGGIGGTIYFQGTTPNGTSTAIPSNSQIITETGTYYFRALSPGGCWGNDAGITCIKTGAAQPNSTNETINAGETATLVASGSSGNYRWYDAASNGNLLFTGSHFTTPTLFENTQYYVEAYSVNVQDVAEYHFTNCGATGPYGPNQSQSNVSYTETNLEGEVTIFGSGIQKWVVPVTGNYFIEASGAQGGTVTTNLLGPDENYAYEGEHVNYEHHAGKKGAVIQGNFDLVAGDELYIIVGQMGTSKEFTDWGGGGGGATFVTKKVDSSPYYVNDISAYVTPLITAGGGGGAGDNGIPTEATGGQATTTTNTNGGTGNFAGAGGGFLGNGVTRGGFSMVNGGVGFVQDEGSGGFGGGGASFNGGGGGGGHQGGDGNDPKGGNGGLSFNNGTNPSGFFNLNAGHGSVFIIHQIEIAGCPSTRNTSTVTVLHETANWIGGTQGHETHWNQASNWSTNSIPTDGNDVIIPNTTHKPIISAGVGADCNDLTVQAGASLTIESGGSLINQGNITNNGQIFTKREISNGVWHLISSPIANAESGMFTGDFLQVFNETTGLYSEITSPDYGLLPAQGFGFYSPGGSTSYTFSGTPNTGLQTRPITLTNVSGYGYDGANLLGNPYPSSIDWDGLRIPYGAVYYWNGAAYVSWNNGGAGSRYIPPMQGFFIVTQAAGTFSLNNNNRTHSGANQYYKSDEELQTKAGIVLITKNETFDDELHITFANESLEAFELERDAWKILTTTPGVSQIYSLCDDGKLSIDSRPETNIIPLGFANDQNGVYEIQVKEMSGIAEATLEDTKLSVFHDLASGPYSFNWQSTDFENRFILHLKATNTAEIPITQNKVFSHQGKLYVKLDDGDDFQQMTVFDLTGRMIYVQPINKSKTHIFDLKKPHGAYMVRLIGVENQQSFKIVL